MGETWQPIEPAELRQIDMADYEAKSDWLSFDCVCADQSNPEWENQPYDFALHTLDRQQFTCPRCGRLYKVNVKFEILMYEPLAVRYPDSKNAPTLGLRDKED